MADSLAVACQTMLAKSLATKDTTSARQVGEGLRAGRGGGVSKWCVSVFCAAVNAPYNYSMPGILGY